MLKICKEHFSKEMELLKTIPGVSDTSAMIIIAETGGDTCTVYEVRGMSVFENSGKITGWAGLRPRNDESAGKYNISTGSITNRNNQRQQISSFYFGTGIMGGIKNKKQLVQRKVYRARYAQVAKKGINSHSEKDIDGNMECTSLQSALQSTIGSCL